MQGEERSREQHMTESVLLRPQNYCSWERGSMTAGPFTGGRRSVPAAALDLQLKMQDRARATRVLKVVEVRRNDRLGGVKSDFLWATSLQLGELRYNRIAEGKVQYVTLSMLYASVFSTL